MEETLVPFLGMTVSMIMSGHPGQAFAQDGYVSTRIKILDHQDGQPLKMVLPILVICACFRIARLINIKIICFRFGMTKSKFIPEFTGP
ncbi:hypothetical protein [Desulforapulum autotrophicum]|uniref:hypothetical protein n=1 Tax=Desulforapulum autotrophicum TaxID=2296 RepID=UPI00059C0AD2|nr:hypothetical protein [Desulforapulum autotrophicum]